MRSIIRDRCNAGTCFLVIGGDLLNVAALSLLSSLGAKEGAVKPFDVERFVVHDCRASACGRA